MSEIIFPQEKDPSDMDYYEALIDTQWLDTATLSNPSIRVDESSGLQIGDVQVQTNKIRWQMAGGAFGTHQIVLAFTSQDRSLERTVYVVVKDN